MTILCAWCGDHMSGPEPDEGAEVSHGCCAFCFAHLVAEAEAEAVRVCPDRRGDHRESGAFPGLA